MRDVFSFLTGIVLGGAVALLMAPEKGSKTRKNLKKTAKTLQKDLEAQADRSLVRMNEYKEKGIQQLNDLKSQTQELIENAAKKVNSKSVESTEV